MIIIKSLGFDPQSITLKDDAAHKRKFFGNIETWYFDAVYDNNYSTVSLISSIQLLNTGVVLNSLFIYKDFKLIKNVRSSTLIKHYYSSKERPHIKIRDKEIINGNINNETKEWIYHIIMGDQKYNANLYFKKKMEPWKGKHFIGAWVVVPRLEVTGNISVDGKKINVSGYGYHDHNNYPLFPSLISKGANFGKIIAGPINIIWAQVVRTTNEIDNIVVINKDKKFISVSPNDIQLSVLESTKEHGKIVPTKYHLKVEKQNIFINVEIESLNYHFITIPLVKYWRHHAKNIGEIKIDSVKKKISNIEIIDQLTFL